MKFVNLARLLQIIRYDPVLYMNLNKLHELKFGNQRRVEVKKRDDAVREPTVRESALDRSRSGFMGSNLLSIIQKYTIAGSFLRELTEIIRKVNMKGGAQNEPQPTNQSLSARVVNQAASKYMSPDNRNYEKQTRMNAMIPTASGVISSPDPRQQDSIQVANRNAPIVIPEVRTFTQQPPGRRATLNNSDSDDDADINSSADIGSQRDSEPEHKPIAQLNNYRKAK